MIIVLVKNLQKNHHGCWIVSLELDHFFSMVSDTVSLGCWKDAFKEEIDVIFQRQNR
jgi:hypothetical protein